MILHHPGWHGAFTREQAPGALPNGTRVRKCISEKGDAHPAGTLGTVLGSIRVPPDNPVYGYFIEWDPSPRCAVGVVSWRIEPA